MDDNESNQVGVQIAGGILSNVTNKTTQHAEVGGKYALRVSLKREAARRRLFLSFMR